MADQKAPPGSGGAPHYYMPPQIFRLCNMPAPIIVYPCSNDYHYFNTKLLLGFTFFSLWLNFQYEVFIFFERLCANSSEMLPLFSSTQHCTRLWPSARHQARDEDEQGEKSHFRVPSVNSLFTPKDKRFPLRTACTQPEHSIQTRQLSYAEQN